MFKSFSELMKKASKKGKKNIVVAGAADDVVLKAIKLSQERGLVRCILIGDEKEIKNISSKIGYDLTGSKIINEKDSIQIARKAVDQVEKERADMLMKGMIPTSVFLKAILKSNIRMENTLLSHVAVLESSNYANLFLITDVAMNINPNLSEKVQIIQNAIKVAKAMECDIPKIAILSAVETVSTKIASTIDASILSKMAERGQIKNSIIDGPLALDIAMSLHSAQHKGVKSQVAGKTDILVAPNIETGNALYKAIVFFGKASMAGIIVGAKIPVILTSRTDSEESKLFSIALGVLMS